MCVRAHTRTRGLFCSLDGLFLDLATHHAVGDGRSDEDGRERSEDDTERHGEGEALDAAAADEQDAEQHNQRRERGVIFGTLSSIFIASPIAYRVMGRKIKQEVEKA